MKLESVEEKVRRLEDWHRWFAWFPVQVPDSEKGWIDEPYGMKTLWLQFVWRHGIFHRGICYCWRYLEIGNEFNLRDL